MSQPFRLIAAKGMQNGIFRLWYGAADNDQSPFVLTLTPQYVAHALRKALPVTIAHDARACGQNAKVLG
jgi:hypothetical protein